MKTRGNVEERSVVQGMMSLSGRIRSLLRAPPARPVLSSRKAYAIWAASYIPRAHNAFMAFEEEVVLGVLPDLAGRRVLDLACGSGRYAQVALQRGAKLVVGADNSLPMLRRGSGFPRLLAEMIQHPCLYINGERRTFIANDGKSYDVEHYPHLVTDYFAALDAAGLVISAIRERKAVVQGKIAPAVLVIAARRALAPVAA